MKNTLDIEKLEKIKWKHIHKRKRTPFYNYILWDGITHHYNQQIQFPYEMKNWLSLDGDLMVDDFGYRYLEDEAVQELKNDPGFFQKIVGIAYALDSQIVDFLNNLEEESMSKKVSRAELAARLETYLNLSLKAASSMLFPMFLESYLEKEIKNSVIKFYGEKAESVMHILSVPVKLSATLEEEISVLKTALKEDISQDDLDQLSEKYGWLKNSLMDESYYLPEDYQKRIQDLIDNKNVKEKLYIIEEEVEQHKVRVEEIKADLGEDIGKLIDTLSEAVYFRSWRTERMYRNILFIKNFINSVRLELGLEKSLDLFFLTPVEIINLLQNDLKADLQLIQERKRGFIIFADGKDTNIYNGVVVEEAKKKINFLGNISEKISGQVAFPGKVSGKVLVIKNRDEFLKVNGDFILVAPSTTPDYVPIMKKSLAIITDEGGILSHASVISRELKIPCIIGTKNSTRVLKDGDTVEVDADKGVVKVIK